MATMYEPKPIDTSRVALPRPLLDLVEKIAEQVHEIWSKQRVEQGWTYGSRRDDLRKEHPNLVPYGRLAEVDKDYDRSTAFGTLRLIVALGYTIEPPSATAGRRARRPARRARAARAP